MSIKSKFLTGVLVVAFMLVGVVAVNANTASADCTITMTLRLGSSGAEVMCLQGKVGATVDGKFGPMTLNAVKVWQAAHGLVADGVVGPMTRAALAGVAGGTPPQGGCQPGWAFNPATGQPCTGGTTPPSGNGNNNGSGLQGGAGDITIDELSTYSNEEVGEGEEDVKVMAFEIEADDESDVEITSVKVELMQQNSADSEDLEDYAESISVWMGSEKVGEADVEDFSEDDDVWSKSISLDDAVVEAGDTEKFYVAVTAQGNLDSGDIDSDDWAIGLASVRFVDAEGVTTTETLDLDIDNGNANLAAGDDVSQEFDFADFATASDVELKVSLNDSEDDVNEAHVIDVDDSDDTDDVELLAFTLEAEGSDIMVTEIPVNVDVTGAANIDDMVTGISLWMDDEEIATESVGSAVGTDETYTFDDLEIEISEGDEVELVVKVDLKSTGDVDLDNGDTISAQIGSTERGNIEAEDESGEELASGDMTGTAVGEASVVYDAGIMVQFVSSSSDETFTGDDTGEADQAEFKITFKVTAFDGDMRIDRSCEEGGADAAGQGVEYTITNSGSNSTTCVLTSSSTDTEDNSNVFEVDEDTTRTFTLTVNATASATAFAEVALESINWGTATDNTNANYYTFDLGDYKTDAENLALVP